MASVEAIDFNPDAVLLAQSNAKNLAIANVEIYQSDWFSAVNSAKVFDVIVSNPPYIDQDDPHLSQGDVVFEPNSALVAAANGLADIRHIATQAKSYLTAGGRLYIEHGYQQGLAVRDILTELGYRDVVTAKDYGGNDRISYGTFT